MEFLIDCDLLLNLEGKKMHAYNERCRAHLRFLTYLALAPLLPGTSEQCHLSRLAGSSHNGDIPRLRDYVSVKESWNYTSAGPKSSLCCPRLKAWLNSYSMPFWWGAPVTKNRLFGRGPSFPEMCSWPPVDGLPPLPKNLHLPIARSEASNPRG